MLPRDFQENHRMVQLPHQHTTTGSQGQGSQVHVVSLLKSQKKSLELLPHCVQKVQLHFFTREVK